MGSRRDAWGPTVGDLAAAIRRKTATRADNPTTDDSLASVGLTRRGMWASATLGTWIIAGIVATVRGESAAELIGQLIGTALGLGVVFWLIYPLISSRAPIGWYQADPALPPFPPVLPEVELDNDQANPAPATGGPSISLAIAGWVFRAIAFCLAPLGVMARFFGRVLG